MSSDISMTESSSIYNGRFYKNVRVNLAYKDMKHVIGKNGRHLHTICKSHGADKIWHNKERQLFHIWGNQQSLESAASALREHVENVVKRYRLKTCEETPYEEDVCVRGSLEGAIEPKDMMHMIGSKGRHFKNVTSRAGVSYIWYDDANHLVEIWGAPSTIGQAHDKLHALLRSTHETIKKYSQ